jgi:hypothetical protein
MARSGDTNVQFNEGFFESILRTAPVEALVDGVGNRTLDIAQATAPVDTEEYRDGLHIEHHESRYRRTTRVVGSDPKTLLIESTTGNLARALKGAKG